MIFRPKKPAWLWDTWLFEWQGQYHLYYLESHGEKYWDYVGHTVSEDLVHWTSCPSIYTEGKAGQWDHEPTLTGMVVQHDGKFYMFVGATWNKRQVVGVYISDDLYDWHPYSGNPVMMSQFPHYMTEPAGPFGEVDFRDPCITFRPEDGYYHALLCARRPNFSHNDTGATIAHLRSKNLLDWESLPPVNADVSRFYHTEVPDIFQLDGRYYLIFSTMSFGGMHLNTPSREFAAGAFYMISDSVNGPFTLPKEYLLIGAGNAKMGSYVARTIPYKGGRLMYHHIKSIERPAFSTPKMIATRNDHSLYLRYMPVVEKLETAVRISTIDNIKALKAKDLGIWYRDANSIIGTAGVLGTACEILDIAHDFHIQFTVKSVTAENAGVVLRCDANNKNYPGVLLNFNFAYKRIEIGCSRYGPLAGWGPDIDAVVNLRNFQPWDSCNYDLQQNTDYSVRCFARNEFFEVYVNNVWVSTLVLDNASKQGGVQLSVARGQAYFSNIRIADIEPLD
jgi:beta-fructofuranosidase